MSTKPNIWSLLAHYPVLDKDRNVVTTSVTNMDVHDLARTSHTYGLGRLVIATPIDIHREMVMNVTEHWQDPATWKRTPSRKEALEIVQVAESIEAAAEKMEKETGKKPDIVGTTAKPTEGAISYEAMRKQIFSSPGRPRLIIFGTGWGLAPQALDMCSCILEPVEGPGNYRHLSVRSAAAVILDRLLGKK